MPANRAIFGSEGCHAGGVVGAIAGLVWGRDAGGIAWLWATGADAGVRISSAALSQPAGSSDTAANDIRMNPRMIGKG